MSSTVSLVQGQAERMKRTFEYTERNEARENVCLSTFRFRLAPLLSFALFSSLSKFHDAVQDVPAEVVNSVYSVH